MNLVLKIYNFQNMQTVLNIVSKKQNLSYPLVFKKIGKYYWNYEQIVKSMNFDENKIYTLCIENRWHKMYSCLHQLILLQYASNYGCLDIIKTIFDKNILTDIDKDDALCVSAEKGHLEIVKFLVENGADINSFDGYPWHFAKLNNHKHILEYFQNIK